MELLSQLNEDTPTSSSKIRSCKFSVLSSESATTNELIEELYRLKRNLLLKSNKNVHRQSSLLLSDEQVATILSMLPDEVICNPSSYKMRSFEAAVVFADVSGFTDLSEKYQRVENGASKLSTVLNFYLGTMVVSSYLWTLSSISNKSSSS